MAAYIRFTKKGSKEFANFSDMDDEIREYFGAKPDRVHYYLEWYDIIGLRLAIGQKWSKILDELKDEQDLFAVAQYIKDNYDNTSWYSR